MNHLAHAALSGTNTATLTGNLSADFLRKRQALQLPEALQAGIRLHRLIDFTTDNDASVRGAWAVLRKRHGKYASVVFDIYCDYLLTQNWSTSGVGELPAFAATIYRAIGAHAHELPGELADRLTRMSDANWLLGYGSYERLAAVFGHFRRRLSEPERLDGVIDTLRENETTLAARFAEFYPRLRKTCSDWRAAGETAGEPHGG